MTTDSEVRAAGAGGLGPGLGETRLSIRRGSTTLDASLFWPRAIISSLRLAPHTLLMLGLAERTLFKQDLIRWSNIYYGATPASTTDFLKLFVIFMTFTPEFRNIFYLRFGIKAKLFSWLCRPVPTLQIASTDIGPGLFVQHGVSTLISAKRIGANFWVNQQVSIGYSNKTDAPTIGDNVTVSPGAKLIGKITVGDNVTVGPNSVVIDNVPSNVAVLGVPARIVSRRASVAGSIGRTGTGLVEHSR
jgi:serine O-acetyltransferase